MPRRSSGGTGCSPSFGLGSQLHHEGLDGQQRGGVGAQAAAALLDGGDTGQRLLGARRTGGLVDGVGQVEVDALDVTAHLSGEHVTVEGQQVNHGPVQHVGTGALGAALLVLLELADLGAQGRRDLPVALQAEGAGELGLLAGVALGGGLLGLGLGGLHQGGGGQDGVPDTAQGDGGQQEAAAPVPGVSVGDAVLAAASLVDAAESEAKEATAERDAREKAELTRALGLESDGKIPAALRAQIRQLEEDQKRRAKRARTDVLDRAMIDLLSFYRDVLTTQMGSDVERVNLDLSDAVDQAARTTSPEQSLARIAAIEECRSRLRSNAAPLLAVEALMVQLRPQAEGR